MATRYLPCPEFAGQWFHPTQHGCTCGAAHAPWDIPASKWPKP